MAARRLNEPIEPMTLGNMRANGVHSLDVSCWQCHHRTILSADPWAALNLLAACPDGCTEAALKANGFGIGLMATLVRAGLAVATPGMVQAGGRTLGVVRLAITEMGRATVGA